MIRLPRPGPRAALLAVVATVLLALVGSSVAQASAVKLTTRLKPFTTSQSRCTSQAVTVTNAPFEGATSNVILGGVDAAKCAGKALAVTVYDPAVATWPAARRLEATGSVTTATATLTGTTGTFTPSVNLKVRVTIDGWEVPAFWSYTTPVPLITCVVPGNASATCSATIDTALGSPASEYLSTIRVTGGSWAPTKWRVTINLSDPRLPFVASALRDSQGRLDLVETSGCAAYPRTVTVEGGGLFYDYVSSLATQSFQVRGYSTNQTAALLLNCP